MQATSFFSSSTTLVVHKHPAPMMPCRRRRNISAMDASGRGSNSKGRDFGGRLVDENMIVLRMRIQEAKLSEASESDQPPSHWMEWEKKYYVDYNQDVCEAMGLLQNYLMSVRPSFALGIVALFTLSVLVSSGLVITHAFKIAQLILSGIHSS